MATEKPAKIPKGAIRYKLGTAPIVFMWQPTWWRTLETPAELRKFERDLQKRVGLSGKYTNPTATYTECGCPEPDD